MVYLKDFLLIGFWKFGWKHEGNQMMKIILGLITKQVLNGC